MSAKLQTTSNALGIALEKGIVILCFVRGLIKNLKNYQLEYQVPEAEKFDDVVFHTGNGQILLIQLKNKEDGTLKLDHLDLFKNKFGEPFNLLKYVKSVINMNKTNKFRDKIDMAVVYTNIDLDVNNQDILSLAKYPKPWFGGISSIQVKRVNLPSNSILQFPSYNGKFYKFTDDPNTLQILEEQAKFLQNENLKIIANRLKKQIADLTDDEILDQLERLKLTNFDLTRDEIEEALKSVIYAVAQPSVEQLTSIIKTDIKTHFCIENVDDIYNSLDVKIGNWCDLKTKCDPAVGFNTEFLTFTQADSFFQQRVKAIMFNVVPPDTSFYGRVKELESIKSSLNDRRNIVISQTMAISGFGGIGKTQLARQFVAKYGKSEFYGRVIWIGAENDTSVEASFIQLADLLQLKKLLDIENVIKSVFDYFYGFKALFVFDNYDKGHENNKSNLVAFCRDYINQANFIHRPYFIFTSRRKKCFSQISELELSVFTKTEAEMFLKTEFMKVPGLKWNKKDTRKLASTLQYFPLALQQAVSYIRNKRKQLYFENFDVFEYLSIFKSKTDDLLDYNFPESFGKYGKTTITTFDVTFDAILHDQQKPKETCELSIEVLQFLAYLYADEINPRLFLSYFNNDTNHVSDVISLLEEYSIISTTKQNNLNIIKIHRLVQEVIRYKYRENEGANIQKLMKIVIPNVYEAFLRYRDIFFFGRAGFFHKYNFKKARKATFKRAVDECTPEQILHMVLIVKHLRQSTVLFQFKNYDKLCKAICNKAFQLTTSIKHDPHADKSFTVSKLFMDNYAEMDVFKLLKRKPVDELKKFIDSVKIDRDNLPPFFVICTWNRLDMVKYMIEIGVNINQKNEHGETPLLYSLRFQIETFQAKFKKKTMITVYYKLLNYCTNMMDAYFEIFTYLIQNGANVNSSDLRGNTPLHIAMKCDYIKISEYLIESGADVNAKNMKGYTPLHIAAKYNNFNNVKLLIDKGADITIESEEGLTALNMTTNKDIENLMRGTYSEPLLNSRRKSYLLKALVHLVLYPLVLIWYERLQRYSEENWNFDPIPDWLIVILSMVAYSIAYCFLAFYYKNQKLFRKYEFI